MNLLNNRWATKHYLMICFIATVSLIAGCPDLRAVVEALGLARDTWLSGLYWSIGVFAAVALFYAVAASLPITRKGSPVTSGRRSKAGRAFFTSRRFDSVRYRVAGGDGFSIRPARGRR